MSDHFPASQNLFYEVITMMKAKRFIASILALAVTASALPAVNFPTASVKATTGTTASTDAYFYNQLKDSTDASAAAYQNFYKAMEKMLDDGMFAEGKDLDLVDAGYFTSEQVGQYANGAGNVLNIYGAARDAFTGDHPEVFYVDFSALSIRIKKLNGEYHLYLGSGRRETYWTESFKNADAVKQAISEYESKFNEAYSSLADSTDADFVEAAHDYITKHTSYRLENKFDPDDTDQYLIRTAYGSLVNQKAVCEGYARLFKAFVDKKGIPCVLVQGAYRPTPESYELHMWTYVELDGTWYAVDPTMDDPTNPKGNTLGTDGFENHEYLLKGENKMAVKYAPSGIRSESNYEFTYPTLNYDNYGNEVVYNTNGLIVTLEEGEQQEGEKCGVFRISYKGMGLQAAREAGYYFLYDCYAERGGVSSQSRSTSKGDKSYDQLVAEAGIGDLAWTGMTYMGLTQPPVHFDSESEATGDYYDTPENLVIKLPQVPYVKFSVTKVKPGDYEWNGYVIPGGDSTFHGTPEDQLATTDSLFNQNGMYKAPPYPKEVTPGLTSALLIDDGSREISATFDQNLQIDKEYLAENNGRISLRVDIQDMYDIANTSGFEHSSFTNLRLILANGDVTEPVSCDVRFIDKKADEYTRDAVILKEFDEYTRTFDGIDPSTLVGKTIIGYKFDFTPSTMYADDNIFYDFDIKGIRGNDIEFEYQEMRSDGTYPEPGVDVKKTTIKGKEPIAISFLAAHRCAAYAFQSQGYDWNVFGKPTLMDDLKGTDFSKWNAVGDNSDIVNDGSTLSEALSQLTHRMVLVATDANSEQEAQMDKLLENNQDGLGNFSKAAELENAEYYNVNLTLCKSQIISTGQAVRVTLGFYGPEDKGKTFKVYHFSKDEKGNIIGVNEIPCEITEFGLVVWCDAFSPFAIVPIDIEKAEEVLTGEELDEFKNSLEEKSIIFKTSNIGGTVSSTDVEDGKPGTIKLSNDESATIEIKAEDGYDIESVTIAGNAYPLTKEEKDSKVIVLPYVDLVDSSNVVDVQFVAESVVAREADEGETVEPHETASKFKDGFSAVIGHSASLGGNIGLNFFVEFKEGTKLDDAKAVFTLPNGNTVEASMEPDDATGAYKVSCEVPAKDIGKTVTLRIVLADGRKSVDYTHSVEKYLNSMKNDTAKYAKETEIINALTNYGNAADAFFSNGTVAETAEMEKVTAGDVEGYKATLSDADALPAGISYMSTSLILESETTLRHYFTVDESVVTESDIAKYKLTKKSDGVYYHDFAGIAAQYLDEQKTFTIGDFTLTASPLSYAYAVLKSGTNDELAKLVKTLYLYNKAADAYAEAQKN